MTRIYRLAFLLLLFFISYAAVAPLEGGASVHYIDKLLHFTAFLTLTFFMDLSIKKPLLLGKAAVIFLILYAFAIELVQHFLPYRSAEVFDLVLDLLGILVYLYFAPRIKIRHI